MFERAALIHYHEIGLKGRNRATFEDRLRNNLVFAVRDVGAPPIERIASRFIVPLTDRAVADAVLSACAAVPGVRRVSDALVLSREMHDIRAAAECAMEQAIELAAAGSVRTFAVDARRSSTDHPVPSARTNIEVGAHLQGVFGLGVDLSDPDVTVHIEVVQGAAYVYTRRLPGPGGLPVGSSGVVVALLSAGIDSPVAAWRVARRGAVVVGVHFSGSPQTTDTSTADVYDIAKMLSPYGGIGRVYAIPFGELQREIALACPPHLRVLLYRRLMVRVAEAIASVEGAKALVTGESLGQVASQTLDNIAVVDAVATLPVLRPLAGSDKDEIITEARRLGTYEISIRTHEDCCTLFMPRNPATHASVAEAEAAEAGLDVDDMVERATASSVWRDFPCAAYKPARRPPGACVNT
ncbi:MAG: tRNA uracil 4-sulfurtransferase ThiI [Coriobacteriia bacterium]|nr:tRNA uracil 4-sulfurtransferase ThiI [Coriobacteriia bacterium]